MVKFYAVLIIFIFPFVLLSGCQKEDYAIPSNLQLPTLTGKWFLKVWATKTSTDTNPGNDRIVLNTGITTDDYFEFKANNAATLSSSALNKVYVGYYSAETTANPKTIIFKSNNFVDKFNITEASKNNLIIYQSVATKTGNVTTTVTNTYTYQKN